MYLSILKTPNQQQNKPFLQRKQYLTHQTIILSVCQVIEKDHLLWE